MEQLSKIFNEPVFLDAAERLQLKNLSPEELTIYELSRIQFDEWEATIQYAEEEAREKGMKEGIEKVALSMLQSGLDAEHIMRFTQLPPERIEELRRGLG